MKNNGTEKNPKGSHLSRKQSFAINDRMKQVITMHADSGLCEYTEPHSDQTIADEFSVSKNSVAGLRVECYGRLWSRPVKASGDSAEMLAKLQQFEAGLQRSIVELVQHHNLLIDNLVMNRVANVKHLKIRRPGDDGQIDLLGGGK